MIFRTMLVCDQDISGVDQVPKNMMFWEPDQPVSLTVVFAVSLTIRSCFLVIGKDVRESKDFKGDEIKPSSHLDSLCDLKYL